MLILLLCVNKLKMNSGAGLDVCVFNNVAVEQAWRSGCIMDCHATSRVQFPVKTVLKSSFTSFAKYCKWGCRL